MRITGNAATREVMIDGVRLDPGPSQKIINHSPDGFSWGYGGSGPAQLALAITIHWAEKVKGKTKKIVKRFATENYQMLKHLIIAKLPMDEDFDIELGDPVWTKFKS